MIFYEKIKKEACSVFTFTDHVERREKKTQPQHNYRTRREMMLGSIALQ